MWPSELDHSRRAGTATDESRSGRRALAVLLLLVALGFGLSGLGHDHSEADLSGDDHCTACHFQLSTLLPDPVAQIAVLATPRGNATQIDLFPYASASFRLGPPRRGPPAQLPTA